MISKSLVKLEVIDIFGNTIVTLLNGEQPSGSNSVRWNGTDASGNTVAAGRYIYRMSVGNQVLTGMVTVAR